jgi:hypothetical protein
VPEVSHENFLLDFKAVAERGEGFKPAIANKNLHKISNDNGVRVVNSSTSENLFVKSTMSTKRFPHF